MALAGTGIGLGGLAAACGGDDDSSASAGTSGSGGDPDRKVKLGFIALTDCASIVMAKELGYFAARDLDVSVEKQASWPATRDALLNGQIDGAHCLYSMPYSVATGIGGAGGTALKIAMMLSNNGQGITLASSLSDAGYLDLDAAGEAFGKQSLTFAMTYPGGTHDLWLRYWLKAAGADLDAHRIQPIPPPEMVANMKVGNMDGYSVGAPWNAVGVQQDIGFIAVNSQDIWQHHPEKALVVNEQFAGDRTDVLKDVMGAILEASAWLDDLDNRREAAEAIGVEGYVNAPADEIAGQLEGLFELGNGVPDKTYTDDLMVFSRGGAVNLPRRSHAVWAMAQFQRLGYLDEAPEYLDIADAVILRDLYEEVAAAEGIDVPDDDMTPFDVQLDGVTFDPNDPDEEVNRP